MRAKLLKSVFPMAVVTAALLAWSPTPGQAEAFDCLKNPGSLECLPTWIHTCTCDDT